MNSSISIDQEDAVSRGRHRGLCGRTEPTTLNRRALLRRAGAGFGLLALTDLLARDRLLAADDAPAPGKGPDGPGPPHFAPRARSVIWLFMEGGPAAMDTFDPKRELATHHGKRPGASIDVFFGSPGPLMRPPFRFARHGQTGAWVCDKLPHIARHVDDLAFVKSCVAESPAHGPAMYQMNTGMI